MSGKTILNVGGWDRRLDCMFIARRGGARDWPTIVDYFVLAVRIAAALLGKRVVLPRGSRSAARGAVCAMPLPIYLAARVIWEAHPTVASALSDGTLEVSDAPAVPPYVLAIARVHHRALSKAMRAELNKEMAAEAEADTTEPSTEVVAE